MSRRNKDCDRCGTEDALNVQSVSVVEGDLRVDRDLCEFCATMPGGVSRSNEGVALATVANILVRVIRESRGNQ